MKKTKSYEQNNSSTSDMGKDYTAKIAKPKDLKKLRMPNYK